MKLFAFLLQANDKYDYDKQKAFISDFTKSENLILEDYIEADVSYFIPKGNGIRDLLLQKLSKGDILLVSELSNLGRNMLQVISLIRLLYNEGIRVHFIRQPELSTLDNDNQKLLAIYKYFADTEREFISFRTKRGLAAAQAKGRLLGRPRGSRNKKSRILDPFKTNIKYYLEINIPVQSILKLINRKLTAPVSYNALKYFIESDGELKLLKKKEESNGNGTK